MNSVTSSPGGSGWRGRAPRLHNWHSRDRVLLSRGSGPAAAVAAARHLRGTLGTTPPQRAWSPGHRDPSERHPATSMESRPRGPLGTCEGRLERCPHNERESRPRGPPGGAGRPPRPRGGVTALQFYQDLQSCRVSHSRLQSKTNSDSARCKRNKGRAEKNKQTYCYFSFEVAYFLRLSMRQDALITILFLIASFLSLSPEGKLLFVKT